jgi:hypothetical protein
MLSFRPQFGLGGDTPPTVYHWLRSRAPIIYLALYYVTLIEMTNLESKEISKIIKVLKKKGKVLSPKRCYYSLTY